MAFVENEKLQEIFLVIGDKLALVGKKWWYAVLIVLMLLIPAYFLFKLIFTNLLFAGYQGPELINTVAVKEPLVVLDKQIFIFPASLAGGPNQTYSGYVKIKNINLEWGVAKQDYQVEFRTVGGTLIDRFERSTFILPASEKLIALPRFVNELKPDQIIVSLSQTHFIRKPEVTINFEVQRTSLQNSPDGLVVSSAFKNLTPFTIKQVSLPVAVFNNRNEIIGVNYTYINEVKSSETRTFQYAWPNQIPGAMRAEVNPEVDIFDRNIFSNEPGASQF